MFGRRGDDVVAGNEDGDYLEGGFGRDRVDGGPGNDRIFGNQDADVLEGGDGDDRISAIDGVADRIACGPGRDVALIDPEDTVAADCESVRR